jgi:iron complex outermembrane recepter protein
MNKLHITSAVIALLAAVAAHSAEPETEGVALQEVTVTAQKVTESLRDVPISMSVVSADAIERQHIEDIGDITRVVPNFSFSSNGNAGGSILEMRGISSAAGASPVAIYVDDVSITERLTGGSLGQPEPKLLDMQQIEVLRGPQGTLYGASAEAGVLKFRSNPVDLRSFDASGLAEGSYTHDGGANYRANGVLNLPLVDGLFGLRIAAENDRNSGFIDRYSPDTGLRVAANVNDVEDTVARLSLEARPLEALSITASLFYQRSLYGSTNTVTLGLAALSNDSYVADSGANKLLVPSLKISLDTGWSELTSITSDYTRSSPSQYDGTVFNSVYIGDCILDGACGGAPIPDLNGSLSGSIIDALPSPAYDTSFSRVISQELRLNSRSYEAGGFPLTWVMGLYYQKSDDHHGDYEYIPLFNSVFSRYYGTALLDEIFGGPLPNGLIYYGTYRFGEKQYSAFGDLTWHLNDALRASVGLRYLSATFDVTQAAGGFFAGGSSGFTAQSRDHAVTPKATVEYQLTSSDMVYATASKGFRLGGPNAPLPSFCGQDLAGFGLSAAPQGYDHDSLWNYELGAKLRPNDRIAVDAAAFYDRWSQLQQAFYLPDCGSSFTTNVGAAQSYGGELQVSARPLEGVTVALAGGYTNARLTETLAAAGLSRGTRIEGVPDWSGTASIEYERPLAGEWFGAIRGDYSYVGESHGSLIATDPDYYRRSYGIAGARISARVRNWEIAVFAKNLFNDQKIIQTPDHASVPTGLVLTPRTVGLSIDAHL